jgi:hypothetical protein
MEASFDVTVQEIKKAKWLAKRERLRAKHGKGSI